MMEEIDTVGIFELAEVSDDLKRIAGKVIRGERVTVEEGIVLFTEGDLGCLGKLADMVRLRKNGDRAYFIRNFHIEPTNICVNKCKFCSYSHHFSKTKWELSVEEIIDKVKEPENAVPELHITGAVHPDRDLYYYGDLLVKIKAVRHDLHIKAYSAVEIDYMIKKAGLSNVEGL